MATNLLWFVLAGFLLGFATSTLWEWFYFRKERLKLTDRRILELEAKLREPESTTERIAPANTAVTNSLAKQAAQPSAPMADAAMTSSAQTSAWGDPAYRSPGVFLETEEIEAEGGEMSAGGRGRARIKTTGTPNAAPSISSPEPTITPRSEPSPADALRARRGDSPRSRQEVLAALRRNSELAQRGQALHSEADASPVDAPRPSPSRGSTLVSPTPPPMQEPPAIEVDKTEPSPAPSDLTPARQRWINDPALTRRSQEYPDDLSKIKGIGDVYKQRLYRAGIYTWKQIAEGDIETLRRATSAYPSSNVEEWLVQAQKLIEKHGRANAVYSGPPPDDMTKILGIGPVSAAALYRAGICTYEQLASTSIAELEELFPIAVAGDQPDFAQWVARAANLADDKHRAHEHPK
jgi:predicted flap endonuclease-1-like 5' DNA nuclease